jgi:DNA transformation protein
MAGRSELLDYLVDQLSPLGDARGRSMFGGHGVYLDGTIVGIIAFDTFYLKVDEGNRAAFEAAGSAPFAYEGKGKPMIMSYWECPADVLDDPDRLRAWTLQAFAASKRSRAKPARRSAARDRKSRRRGTA